MSRQSDASFKDHFSGHADAYAASRPTYPDELFAFLAASCDHRDCAWDCATGSGQAARSLAPHFRRVIATDASQRQIDAAIRDDRVHYRARPAEDCGLKSGSVDLITVAQALHWFDIDAFFREASRVLRPGGLLAYWCYGICTIETSLDDIVERVYTFVDDYWPPERRIVEGGYRGIEPPLPILAAPGFDMRIDWSADEMLAYLSTWSACQRFRHATARDPLEGFGDALRERWGPGLRPVSWPLHLTVCGPAGRK